MCCSPHCFADRAATHYHTRAWQTLIHEKECFILLLTHELTGTDWNSLKDNNVDVYAPNVTDRILYLVNKHIPNKHVRIRKSDPPWLSNNIKRLMRKRKRFYDKYKRSENQSDFNKYKQVRNEVTFAVRKAESEEIDKLSNKLKDPNIGGKPLKAL